MRKTDSQKISSYVARINSKLKSKPKGHPLVLDLFAGCGGLSLGFEAQGFATLGWEMVPDYAATYNANLKGECRVETLTPDSEYPAASIVIGGPPCQPFSVGGNQHGLKDSRDGFPIFISCIKKVNPDIWLFENVRGLMYRNKWYLEEIIEKLAALGYVIEEPRILNAKHFGVPQNRERLFVVGHRGIFKFPQRETQLVTSGEAIGDYALKIPPESKFLTPSMDKYVAKYEKASKCIRPRDLDLHQPVRTLTCRNLAGATGDMMRVQLPDGRRRRLLIREAARLQSFPDWFKFSGGENSQFYQIGNAVPPMLAYHLAGSVRNYLHSSDRLSNEEIIIKGVAKQLELPISLERNP